MEKLIELVYELQHANDERTLEIIKEMRELMGTHKEG